MFGRRSLLHKFEFKEGLESSSSFLTAVLQTKCQKLAKPTILRETTDRKNKGKEGKEVRTDL